MVHRIETIIFFILPQTVSTKLTTTVYSTSKHHFLPPNSALAGEGVHAVERAGGEGAALREAAEGAAAAHDVSGARGSASHSIAKGILPAKDDLSIQDAAAARFRWIESLLAGVVCVPQAPSALVGFDRIAIGSFWSKPLAVLMILLGFLLAFIPAVPIMALGGGISSLGRMIALALAEAGAPEVLGAFLSGVVFNSLCFGVMMVGRRPGDPDPGYPKKIK